MANRERTDITALLGMTMQGPSTMTYNDCVLTSYDSDQVSFTTKDGKRMTLLRWPVIIARYEVDAQGNEITAPRIIS